MSLACDHEVTAKDNQKTTAVKKSKSQSKGKVTAKATAKTPAKVAQTAKAKAKTATASSNFMRIVPSKMESYITNWNFTIWIYKIKPCRSL